MLNQKIHWHKCQLKQLQENQDFYGMNVYVPQCLIPSVMVFGDGDFEISLGHEDGTLMNGICTLTRRGQRASSPALSIM